LALRVRSLLLCIFLVALAIARAVASEALMVSSVLHFYF
jgi:hypothetical protein